MAGRQIESGWAVLGPVLETEAGPKALPLAYGHRPTPDGERYQFVDVEQVIGEAPGGPAQFGRATADRPGDVPRVTRQRGGFNHGVIPNTPA